MKKSITANGNLRLDIDGVDDAIWLREALERLGGDDRLYLAELLEYTGWQPSGQLVPLRPEQVGALTDSPIMTDLAIFDVADVLRATGNLYWYPAYETRHFAEELLQHGFVIWTRAESVSETDQAAPATPA